MVKELKSLAARLSNAVKVRTSSDFLRRREYSNIGITGKPPELGKPEIWALCARGALTLGSKDKALRYTFESFGLDPGDPRDWRALLDVLAEVIGPELATEMTVERKRAGAKRIWTIERREELVEAVQRIKQSSVKKLTDSQACKALRDDEDSPPYFRKAKTSALVKQAVLGRTQWVRRAKRRGRKLPPSLIGRKNRSD